MKRETRNDLAWDARYRANDIPWEKGYAAPPLTEWLSRNEAPSGRILVPGCGTGHDARSLAQAGQASASVVGLDIAASAIRVAKAQTARHAVEFEQGDVLDPPKSWFESFDWVFEHTCFCALDRADRPAYAESVFQLLKPGGHLLAVFFLTPWDPDEDPETAGPPFGTDRLELERLFGSRLPLLYEYVPTQSYPGREQRELVQLRRRTE